MIRITIPKRGGVTAVTNAVGDHWRRTSGIAAAAAATAAPNSRRLLSSSKNDGSLLLSRYGLGGHHWKQFDPNSYKELIYEALTKQVTYLEVAGQEGGDIAMVGAIQSAMERSPHLADNNHTLPITITTRIGYRTLQSQQQQQQQETTPDEQPPPAIIWPGDVAMTEEGEDDNNDNDKAPKVVHNLSNQYIRKTVESSPLNELQEFPNVRLIYLIQNPEVQILEFLKDNPKASLEERQEFIQRRWKPALETLQEYSSDSNNISFGVVSNGLGIPPEHKHPLHLSPDLVIDAAKTYDQFKIIQLPANLLETHGWHTGQKLAKALSSNNVDIVAMRPLTCYPDLGTGNGHPFRLVDYELPCAENENDGDDDNNNNNKKNKTQYTHQMTGIPSLYQIALQTTVSHFDADELLEKKQERDLTMEERETLDGCKLVQSMIHDLDADLDHVRSFAAHEEELYGRIIPLLYDTFEAMDDRTSDVLQTYFAAYAVAVRYAIAKRTRQVLKEGEKGSSKNTVTYPDIPDSMTLQEYALRHMLADKAMSRIVIGASSLEDFRRQLELMQRLSADDSESPLDVIAAAKAREDEAKKAKEEAEAEEEKKDS